MEERMDVKGRVAWGGILLLVAGILWFVIGSGGGTRAGAAVQEQASGAAADQKVAVLQVSGEGMVKVKPDQAQAGVAIETQAATAREAQAANARTTAAVIDKLLALGVKKDDMQTSGLNLYPEHGTRGQVVRYRASNSLQVTVRDLDALGRVVDGAVEAGATNIHGVNFSLQDPAGPQREALAKAVADGREKAAALARAAGLGLGSLRLLNEGGAAPPVAYKMEYAGYMWNGPAAAAPAPPVIPGDLTVRASVHMEYALR